MTRFGKITYSPILLKHFSAEELLKELSQREADSTGGVLFHRVRAVVGGEGPDFILGHLEEIEGGMVRIEVLIDGEWRRHDWMFRGLHKGEYD